MTHIELHRHGDPLVDAFIKEWSKLENVKSEKDRTAKISHKVVLEHDTSRPHTNPLHVEFNCQGDPLLGAFIQEWHVVAGDAGSAKEKADADVHEDMKHHGDPLLAETIAHATKIFRMKQ
jgi:hypothetical protein